MKWIPVSERLPELSEREEYGNWVLVYNGHHIGVGKLLDWADGGDPEWLNECGQPIEASEGCEVIHWMPLPDPPEEQ